MEGLLKLTLIVLILYLLGRLGPRTSRRVETMARRFKNLFGSTSDRSEPDEH